MFGLFGFVDNTFQLKLKNRRMETIFQRFPHLSQEIFDLVDNQSLAKCQEVSLPWYEFLQKQKFRKIREIKSLIESFHEVGDIWKKVFKSATLNLVL